MKSDEPFLRHILDEADYLMGRTHDLTYDQFLKDETLQRAFVRSFEIIGEAAKNPSPDFKRRHKEIDWRAVTGMRDILIHQYFKVDWEILWKVLKGSLLDLRSSVGQALDEIKK